MNVHAEDVEQALRDTGLVTDASVFGIGDPRGDQEVHAVLAMEEPSRAQEAVHAANGRLAVLSTLALALRGLGEPREAAFARTEAIWQARR